MERGEREESERRERGEREESERRARGEREESERRARGEREEREREENGTEKKWVLLASVPKDKSRRVATRRVASIARAPPRVCRSKSNEWHTIECRSPSRAPAPQHARDARARRQPLFRQRRTRAQPRLETCGSRHTHTRSVGGVSCVLSPMGRLSTTNDGHPRPTGARASAAGTRGTPPSNASWRWVSSLCRVVQHRLCEG